MYKYQKIKNKVLIPIVIVISLLLIASIIVIYNIQNNNSSSDITESVSDVQRMFDNFINTETQMLKVNIDYIEKNELIKNAWLKKDRNELINLCNPIFEHIHSNYHISHFYFIDVTDTCFLRVHNSSKYGDVINRYTYNIAKETNKISSGLEMGKFGTFTLRSVKPFFVDNKVIGYIELGMEIDNIIQHWKMIPQTYMFFAVNKKNLKKELWEEGLKADDLIGNWDEYKDYVVISRTSEIIPLPTEIISENAGIKTQFTLNNKIYLTSSIPLNDVGGKSVGVIVVVHDYTDESDYLTRLILYLIVFSVLIGFIIIIFFYKFLSKIESTINVAESKLYEENKNRKIAEQQLIEKNEEYALLNEEYLSQNEELVEKNEEYATLNEEYIVQNETLKAKTEEYESLNEEFQKQNEQLTIALSKSEESEKLKTAFLANMSHEIRTPLNSIIGFSNLLRKPNLKDEKRLSYTNLIISSGNHLLNLINDIIDISKIQSGQLVLYNNDVHINSLLDELYSTFSHLNEEEESGVEIVLIKEFDDGKDIICTDDTRLKQILTNLIGNAVKFTEKGKIEISYKLQNKDYVLFSISDTGIGLDKNETKIIFEHFRQVGYDILRKYGGAGLGLSISKSLVTLLGGEIWVESEKGKGSIFYFTIPYKTQESCTESEDNIRVVNENNNDFTGKTILITEDDENNIEYFNELMEDTNANILIAKTGTDAVTIVKENSNIDIVLMDIQLPDITGYEATIMIKQIRKDLPVIAQTANAMHNDEKKAYDSGCDAYIFKPINSEKLFSLINKLLG